MKTEIPFDLALDLLNHANWTGLQWRDGEHRCQNPYQAAAEAFGRYRENWLNGGDLRWGVGSSWLDDPWTIGQYLPAFLGAAGFRVQSSDGTIDSLFMKFCLQENRQ